MNWWDNVLFDTCSLITVDKLLLDRPQMQAHFSAVRTIEECLSADNMCPDTKGRVRPRVTLASLPPPTTIATVLVQAKLSKSISSVDALVLVTAVDSSCGVVTGDRRLARAATTHGLGTWNVALILKHLVQQQTISSSDCGQILADLVARRDYILPANEPQTWTTLANYTFP